MLGFIIYYLLFIIYYLLSNPHVLSKRIRSYICYPDTFPNTHFLNPMNMIVIAYYAHACYPLWLPWYTFDDCLIIFDKMHVVWCISILTFMFYDSAWETVQVRTLTLLYGNLILFGMLFFEITLVYLDILN